MAAPRRGGVDGVRRRSYGPSRLAPQAAPFLTPQESGAAGCSLLEPQPPRTAGCCLFDPQLLAPQARRAPCRCEARRPGTGFPPVPAPTARRLLRPGQARGNSGAPARPPRPPPHARPAPPARLPRPPPCSSSPHASSRRWRRAPEHDPAAALLPSTLLPPPKPSALDRLLRLARRRADAARPGRVSTRRRCSRDGSAALPRWASWRATVDGVRCDAMPSPDRSCSCRARSYSCTLRRARRARRRWASRGGSAARPPCLGLGRAGDPCARLPPRPSSAACGFGLDLMLL